VDVVVDVVVVVVVGQRLEVFFTVKISQYSAD